MKTREYDKLDAIQQSHILPAMKATNDILQTTENTIYMYKWVFVRQFLF